MGYYVGDIPAHDLVIEPARDLEDFDTASATLTSPDPDVEEPITLDADIVEETIVIAWPEEPVLLFAGMYELRITLETTEGASERLPMVGIIVQDDSDGWHSLDSVREDWVDAPDNDRWLFELLQIAKTQCVEWIDEVEEDEAPDAFSCRLGQRMQSRNIWNASMVAAGGDLGDGTFAIVPRPLDWEVKQILTPRTRIPEVG